MSDSRTQQFFPSSGASNFKLTSEGATATAHPAATASALEILRGGGNAIDAAAAAAWALSVCEPSGSGLGGQTTALVRFNDGGFTVVDGHSHAPAAVSLKTVSRNAQEIGFRACTIPSTPATLGYLQQNWGKLNLEHVLRPAIKLAEDGYAISKLQHRQLKWTQGFLNASTGARRLLLKNSEPYKVGEIFQQKELAATLRHLAEHGVEDFYRGETARQIAEDMRENGGLISEKDLADFSLPVERKPISVKYRGFHIFSVPPPGGGIQLLLAFKIFENLNRNYAIVDWRENIAEAIYAAFVERENSPFNIDDPEQTNSLLSDDYVNAVASAIAGKNFPRKSEREVGGETTHLCVADAEGNMVSLTQSIQSLFGAKVANAKLGFLYNNSLCTCPRLSHSCQLGSRCQPQSNVAPTFVCKDETDKPALVLGAAGSRRITSSILQVISGVIERHLPIDEAVAAPRIHALLSRKIWLEKPLAELSEKLKQNFCQIVIKAEHDYKMGAVQALQFDDEGKCFGAADPRREGTAIVS